MMGTAGGLPPWRLEPLIDQFPMISVTPNGERAAGTTTTVMQNGANSCCYRRSPDLPLPAGEGLSLRERSDRQGERVRGWRYSRRKPCPRRCDGSRRRTGRPLIRPLRGHLLPPGEGKGISGLLFTTPGMAKEWVGQYQPMATLGRSVIGAPVHDPRCEVELEWKPI